MTGAPAERVAESAAGRRRRFVPISLKIIAICTLALLVFGAITVLHARASTSRAMAEMLRDRTFLMARSLVVSLQRPLATEDLLTVGEKIRAVQATLPDVRYVLVRDPDGAVLAHTFDAAVPADLLRASTTEPPEAGSFTVLETAQGDVFNVVLPVLRGHAGTLVLGTGDGMIARERAALTGALLRGLAWSLVVGIALSVLLAHLLTRPVNELEQAVDRIRAGDFTARARVRTGDEIGHLSAAVNEMAASLDSQRRQVDEKERARRLVLGRLVGAQEEERRHIARELHDQVGQSLLAVLLSAQSQCRYTGMDGSACQGIAGRLGETVDEIHRLASGMHPTILDDYGLDSALARYVAEVAGHADFEIDYQQLGATGTSNGSPASHAEVTVYRVAQEALSNILRHAEANRASVVLIRRPETLTLVVEDDGRGFDPQREPSDGGLGLTGMRERAALFGGCCDIESGPGRGTTIRLQIPTPLDAS